MIENKTEKRQYTVNDYLNDKIKREDEIEELYNERERIDEEIREKEERYRLFVNKYLSDNGLALRNFEEDK